MDKLVESGNNGAHHLIQARPGVGSQVIMATLCATYVQLRSCGDSGGFVRVVVQEDRELFRENSLDATKG